MQAAGKVCDRTFWPAALLPPSLPHTSPHQLGLCLPRHPPFGVCDVLGQVAQSPWASVSPGGSQGS